MTDDPRYAKARKRVEDLKGFYIHLALYLAVNLGLFLTDWAQGGGWWFYWATIGWGIGLALHAVALFFEHGRWVRRWEERKFDEYVRDADGPGMNPAK